MTRSNLPSPPTSAASSNAVRRGPASAGSPARQAEPTVGAACRAALSPTAQPTAQPALRDLLVGIGSPHGDDAMGWIVADAASRRCPANIDVRTAAVPLDLLDWLDGVDALHVVDACLGDGSRGDLTRWAWSELADCNSDETPFQGTHGFDLVSVLRLAEKLGRLPSEVVVWGIEVGNVSTSCERQGACLRPFQELHPQLAPCGSHSLGAEQAALQTSRNTCRQSSTRFFRS